MVGTTRPTPGGERRYYRCGGKDCVRTGRAQPCPRACVDGEALERAVWSHLRDLLADPERLTAQFRHFAAEIDRNASREQGPERRLMARLDGLRRADARLLDAYQAEVISLDELTERRRQLAGLRRALECQLEQQRDLRWQRAKAQAVLTDLSAFCERVRGRLDEASFAEKQAVLQLVVERVIVHESSLEIRHVIPLHSPPPGRGGFAEPNGRLRSERVHDIAGPDGGVPAAVAGLGVVGRDHRRHRWRRVALGPEAHAPAASRRPSRPAHEVARPHLPQRLHLRQPPQAVGRSRFVEPGEQRKAVLAHRARIGLAFGLGARQAAVLDAVAVTLAPGLWHGGAQPVRGGGRRAR